MCFNCTAEAVLFIFWPPGPEPQRKTSVKESSGSLGRGGFCFAPPDAVIEKRHEMEVERDTCVCRVRRPRAGQESRAMAMVAPRMSLSSCVV
jgi:hypothetical protein